MRLAFGDALDFGRVQTVRLLLVVVLLRVESAARVAIAL